MLQKTLQIIYTTYFWLCCGIGAGIAAIPTSILALLSWLGWRPASKYIPVVNELIVDWFALRSMEMVGIWSIKIVGSTTYKDILRQGKPVVYIANHTSFIDSFIFLGKFPSVKKFLMARIFFNVPVFGTICRLCGHVPAEIGNTELNGMAVERSIRQVEQGHSFMIFPEGKRNTRNLPLLPFKTGAFRIADRLNCPIIPVTIRGSRECLPIGGMISKGEIVIQVDEPIYVSDYYDPEQDEDIMEWNAIQKCKRICRSRIEQNLGITDN